MTICTISLNIRRPSDIFMLGTTLQITNYEFSTDWTARKKPKHRNGKQSKWICFLILFFSCNLFAYVYHNLKLFQSQHTTTTE